MVMEEIVRIPIFDQQWRDEEYVYLYIINDGLRLMISGKNLYLTMLNKHITLSHPFILKEKG